MPRAKAKTNSSAAKKRTVKTKIQSKRAPRSTVAKTPASPALAKAQEAMDSLQKTIIADRNTVASMRKAVAAARAKAAKSGKMMDKRAVKRAAAAA